MAQIQHWQCCRLMRVEGCKHLMSVYIPLLLGAPLRSVQYAEDAVKVRRRQAVVHDLRLVES